MPARTLPFLLLLLTLPATTQQTSTVGQFDSAIAAAQGGRFVNRNSAAREIRPEPPRDFDLRAARLRSIHQDAEHLSALNAALQLELQQLQKDMLAKDLADNLKKAEKLSKKLRQEVAQ
jgi:hypothetical protein